MIPRLFTNPVSPFCRAASICLDEDEVAHEVVLLVTGADRARLAAVSARREVPVLTLGGTALEGFAAIAAHLANGHSGSQLMPVSAEARRVVAGVERVLIGTTDPLQFLVHLVRFRRPELATERPELAPRIRALVEAHYADLDAALADAEHLAGSAFSRTDVLAFTLVSSLVSMGCALAPEHAALCAWFDRVAARPAVARDSARASASEAAQAHGEDPFFRADRIHWRDHRVEWACRLGLADWLSGEIDAGRAYFSPPPRTGGPTPEDSDR